MQRVRISKDTAPKALEEKITLYLEEREVTPYIALLRRTWPRTRVETSTIRKLA